MKNAITRWRDDLVLFAILVFPGVLGITYLTLLGTLQEGPSPTFPPRPQVAFWSVLLLSICITSLATVKSGRWEKKHVRFLGWEVKQTSVRWICNFAGNAVLIFIMFTAVPAFQKVRWTRVSKAVQGNLHMLGASARDYMLDTGAAKASYRDLVGEGPGYYIRALGIVGDEKYEHIIITTNTTRVSTTLYEREVYWELDFSKAVASPLRAFCISSSIFVTLIPGSGRG